MTSRVCLCVALLVGCNDRATAGGEAAATGIATAGDADVGSSSGDAGEESGAEDGSGRLDVSTPTQPGATCTVVDGGNGVGECTETSPPDSFEPDVQWAWTPEGIETSSVVAPLVGNFTDDNGDGNIDLCDSPDIVVVTYDNTAYRTTGDPNHWKGTLWVLDGETGEVHFQADRGVRNIVTPAIGDIDGDGLLEIVTGTTDTDLVVFENDGTTKFVRPAAQSVAINQGAVALADMDQDGTPEIIAGQSYVRADGTPMFRAPLAVGSSRPTPVPADLDGDSVLDLVLGRAAYSGATGAAIYNKNDFPSGSFEYTEVADLDADGLPEVLLHNDDHVWLLEHNGDVAARMEPMGTNAKNSPAAIHDVDADGEPEILLLFDRQYRVFEADFTEKWATRVFDPSGFAAGTAFDFLGDGQAEAMYADQNELFIFDDNGGALLTSPRSSWTLMEFPIVADVDNDGSAEIVVVSNADRDGNMPSPTLQVVRDAQDRWIQARRIWNQHAYHVTNVHEDGSIPAVEVPHWTELNTYRTNAQIENGATCRPMPVG